MENINHLAASKINHKNCIYSLAARDFNKALDWISSALVHLNLHIEENNPSNSAELYSTMQEYEKLKRAIESGAKNTLSELPVAAGKKVAVSEKPTDDPQGDKPLTFDDVVGLNHIKETIRGAIVYPFKYEDIYSAFKRRSGGGILLYGAPGTGKTMIAKAIAGEIDAEFIPVNCSDVYSKWLGESQQNIKKIFERARKAKRAVIFFDEFEALGCARNSEGGDASGINGVVCELLAQIDGFCSNPQSTVLVIAATNRPWDIDSALRRSGRFERHLYVDMPDESARIEIIQKHMSELPVGELCYDELGKRTDGFSPADVANICNLVKDRAIMRSISENAISNITQEDFVEVLSNTHSTVDLAELARLESFV